MVTEPVARLTFQAPRAGHHDGATDEWLWRGWEGWHALPDAELPGPRTRVVVISAHPDDDVLAVGGLLHRLADRGVEVVLVCATDGEASHPGSPTITPEELAERRTAELADAQRWLGLGGAEQVQLHLPDSRLADHADELGARVAPYLAGAGLALTPWTGDGHPDHAACGLATRAAASGRTPAAVPVWEYPLWAWHWARPGSAELPWERARAVRLAAGERQAKASAVAAFRSQLHPLSRDPADVAPLPAEVIAHFTRPFEVVFT